MSIRPTIIERLKTAFPDAEIELVDTTGTDDHWDLKIVSESFAGMKRVKRHQAVYKPLNDLIAANQVHALAISAMTPEERD